jgi:peptidoglycan hydrolase CwlO-like protein
MKDMQSCRDLLGQHMKDCRSDIDEIKERISNLKQVFEEDRRARDRAHHAETINQITRRRIYRSPATATATTATG